MPRFSIRDILWLTSIGIIAACWLIRHRNAAQQAHETAAKAAIQQREWLAEVNALKGEVASLKQQLNHVTLYPDSVVQRLEVEHAVNVSILGGTSDEKPIVVPVGESWPRRKVFEILEIDHTRLVDFRHRGGGHTATMAWQFSPNYDLVCITAENDGPLPLPPLDHPDRKVYGVHFHKRSGDRRYF